MLSGSVLSARHARLGPGSRVAGVSRVAVVPLYIQFAPTVADRAPLLGTIQRCKVYRFCNSGVNQIPARQQRSTQSKVADS